MWVSTLLIGTVVFLAVKYYRDRKQAQRKLKDLGIPGPAPDFIWGNSIQMRELGFNKTLVKWSKEYGKTFGYYNADRPMIATADVELLRRVLIKDFSKFNCRQKFPMQLGDKYDNLLSAEPVKWKKLRSLSSPMFSGRRMNQMSRMINDIMDRVLRVLDEKVEAAEPFDIYKVWQAMTLDIIGQVAFGIEVSALTNEQDEFLVRCRKIFNAHRSGGMGILRFISLLAPGLFSYLAPILSVFSVESPLVWFLDISKVLILRRKEEGPDPNRYVDLIQLMIDAKEPEKPVQMSDLIATGDDEDEKAEETRSKGEQSGKGGLTMEEMQGQSQLFLLAGYETTSTGLAFLSYELAMNPDVQDRLVAEIDEHFPSEAVRPDYSNVQKLTYLDWVLKETLRLHTIATIVMSRRCNESCCIEGVNIPKGTIVQVNAEAVHLDPEHWGPEDPNLFVPERFEPERVKARHPMAWLPFGGGPHNCIGIRFAQMEVKIALVRMLKTYVIARSAQTPEVLPVSREAVQAPAQGVVIDLRRRAAH